MKNLISSFLILLFCGTNILAQEVNSKNLPEFYKFIHEVPEYINGNVKEIHLETFDGVERNGKIQKSGLLVTNTGYRAGSSFFNSKGQIIHSKGKMLTGDFHGIFHYENKKLKKISWIIDESLRYVWEFSYPEKGKVKNTIYDIQNNTIWGVNSYDLDKNGLIIKQVLQQEGKENNTMLWEREDDGTITDKKHISPEGEIVTHMDKWEYNDNGSKTKVHRRLSNGKEADFYGPTQTFEYDDKGNWIKRTSISPHGDIRVTERKIVYN